MRHMRCPECGRVASVPEWCSRPICVHAWDNYAPEIWDGDDCGSDGGRTIEQSPNEQFRTPGPNTWTEMVAKTDKEEREECPRCQGAGEIAFNLSPINDPQEDRSERCPVCWGDGEIPQETGGDS